MINVVLGIYVVGVVVTLLYAGYNTGRQFRKAAKANPTVPIQINWVSVFYQGLSWPGFWASLVGEYLEKRSTPAGPDINELNKRMKELGKGPRIG